MNRWCVVGGGLLGLTLAHRLAQAGENVTVFEAAYADVSRNFEDLFAMLFPGGSGRLTLANPEDMLNTGVDLEARPSGQTAPRLARLARGERSPGRPARRRRARARGRPSRP